MLHKTQRVMGWIRCPSSATHTYLHQRIQFQQASGGREGSPISDGIILHSLEWCGRTYLQLSHYPILIRCMQWFLEKSGKRTWAMAQKPEPWSKEQPSKQWLPEPIAKPITYDAVTVIKLALKTANPLRLSVIHQIGKPKVWIVQLQDKIAWTQSVEFCLGMANMARRLPKCP